MKVRYSDGIPDEWLMTELLLAEELAGAALGLVLALGLALTLALTPTRTQLPSWVQSPACLRTGQELVNVVTGSQQHWNDLELHRALGAGLGRLGEPVRADGSTLQDRMLELVGVRVMEVLDGGGYCGQSLTTSECGVMVDLGKGCSSNAPASQQQTRYPRQPRHCQKLH